MAEALRCFTYLQQNAPEWIKQVERLEQRINERQHEVTRIPVPVSRQKVRKSGSNESIRPGRDMEENNSPVPSSDGQHIEVTSAPQDIDMPNAQATRQSLLGSQRKRKTSSILSNYTAPAKYRSRSMIIVYYDSTVQEAFNTLVQSISVGRNHLRKAKMAARMEALTRGVAEDDEEDDQDDADDPLGIFKRTVSANNPHLASHKNCSARSIPQQPYPLAVPVANGVGRPGSGGVQDGSHTASDDPLAGADKALEIAQSFCEKGAHQFLRDGDCLEETTNAKAAFNDVLVIAQEQVEKLKEEEWKANERRRLDREARERKMAAMADVKTELPTQPPAGTLLLADGPIEVDDEGSDEQLEEPDLAAMLPSFRLTART